MLSFLYAYFSFFSVFAAELLPPSLAEFSPKKYVIETREEQDINGNGNNEVIFVVKDDDENSETYSGRTLLISQKTPEGYQLLKKSDKAILCAKCGGPFGDPFSGLEFEKNGFVIQTYGGGGERWFNSYTFKYSRQDKTWQLVKAIEGYYDSNKVDKKNSNQNQKHLFHLVILEKYPLMNSILMII